MVANVGDFDPDGARKLKDVGFSGIHHAARMGERGHTRIAPEQMLETGRAAQEGGDEVGTCLEPVGPEHTTAETVEKMLIGREMKPFCTGAARRVSIPGSELQLFGVISECGRAHLVPVAPLAMGQGVIGNGTHEPNALGATAGANFLWAEVGANPREAKEETREGRAPDVQACARMFPEADSALLDDPSVIYGGQERA